MTGSRDILRRYYLFRMTNSAGLYLPVAILYLQRRGFGLDFIGFAYAVYALGTLAAEIPSGYLGDLLGRRASLAIGSGLRVVVLGSYPFVEGPLSFLVLHVVWATGRAFRSGTQDAWLYELLQAHFDESQFARIESRGSTALLVTSAVGAIVGALLYGLHPAYPFLANAGLAALGIPLLITFPTVERGDVADERPKADAFTVREAIEMLHVQATRPEVRWLVVYAALFNALFVVTRVYEQPALDAVGVPVAGLGLLYASFKLLSAAGASTVGWLHDRLGTRGILAAVIPLYAIAYAAIAFAPVLVIPVLFLNRGCRTVTQPVRNQYLNDRLGDVGRATVLSGVSMALAFVGAIARLVAGPLAESFGPVRVLPRIGVPIAIAGGLLWIVVSPVRPGGRHRSTDPDGAVVPD